MSKTNNQSITLHQCTLIGVNGFPFVVGEKISLTFGEDGLHCLGLKRAASVGYVELAEIGISGPGTVTSGGGFIGGGFGIEEAIEGMAIAGVLNLLTTRSKIHTFITIVANFGELHLHYSEMEPGALRMVLAPVYVKLRRLDPAWIAEKMKILEAQKSVGALTEEGFNAARQRLLVASEWKDPVIEAAELRILEEAKQKAEFENGPKGKCPNCDATIFLHAESCPRCKSIFGAGSAWQVIPVES